MGRSLALALILAVWAGLASAQVPTVAIFNDSLGVDCNLSQTSPGVFKAYVVLTSTTVGVTGVQFAAPKPSCLTGSYLVDLTRFPVTIGNSQTGISIGFGGCLSGRIHVLTILYLTDATTPACCAYPVLPDPVEGIVGYTDCSFELFAGEGWVSTINGDASCPCDQSLPPTVPSSPSPADHEFNCYQNTDLSWASTDPEGFPLTYDVYFGTGPNPPLVSHDKLGNTYQPGLLALATTYYWRIVARNVHGKTTEGPTWSFTTQADMSSRLVVSRLIHYCGLVTTDTVAVDLAVENNAWPISAAGVDIGYDPALLTFLSGEKGGLTAGWSTFGVEDRGTKIRVGGYDPTAIPAGSNGAFARLFFLMDCCAEDSTVTVALCPENQTDDFIVLWPQCGEVKCEKYTHDGDVTGDGAVTPRDALCAFEGYMSFPDPPALGCDHPGWDVRGDVNCSASVTPGDALCIFNHWLNGSCAFCGGSAAPGLAASSGSTTVVFEDARVDGGHLSVVLGADGPGIIGAFGLDIAYPTERLEFLDAVWRMPSDKFERIEARVRPAGELRLGGYAEDAVDASVSGLVELRFRISSSSEGGAIVARGFTDDLAGSEEAKLELDAITGGSPAVADYALHQNVPNPFNPSTEIRFETPSAGAVSLAVYDVEGRLIKRLADGPMPRGVHHVEWNGDDERGADVSSGVYFYVMRAGERTLTRKMVYLK
jgi:hypothetical protein